MIETQGLCQSRPDTVAWCHAFAGSVTRKQLGRDGRGATTASPPCSRAIWRTSESPSPAPALSSLEPVERREHALALGLRDARPGVDDVEDETAPLPPQLDLDRRRAVAPRIVDEIADQPPQQPRIAAHERRRAVETAALHARAFLGEQRQQVDLLDRLQRRLSTRAGSPAGSRRPAHRARRCRARSDP